IKSPYYINQADLVACHNQSYIIKGYKMVQDVKKGGTFLINCQWSDEELDKHLPAESKKYIADNNIKVYTVDAVKLATQVGLGKRTSTVLQSAFFKLAGVLPADEAIKYMKEKVVAKFSKKGQEVVDMNCNAIDLGAGALHEVAIPASWSNPAPDAAKPALEGEKKTVAMVEKLMNPISLMDGDNLPVSAFKDIADGQFELGASAYEKRGTAVMIPSWNADTCAQCNNCAFVCSHATIRPYLLTADEASKVEGLGAKTVAAKLPKFAAYKYTLSVSPLDCMGCGECTTVCPTNSLTMVPQETLVQNQPQWNYLVANVSKKPEVDSMPLSPLTSQFNQPLLEFSGSCAGCAETSYARLITQLFGERMYISNATGCSSIWGGPAATAPYTINKDSKKGPAWANSLFEDNAEHGLGMYAGQKYLREAAVENVRACVESDKASAELKAAFAKFEETYNNTDLNSEATDALVAELEKAASAGCENAKAALEKKDYLSKKAVWIFGGDGWAYDIGFGGLDHVLASGENINVMVFDTEMYSNTGGQASKASNIGEVCQFASAGKEVGKKSLSEIAMSYGYVYVAQIALGANPTQALKAIKEAEAYNGPSLIIGYAPCELHGVKGGMTHCQDEMKAAVKAGYWNLFSFNPALKAEGKNPFTLTSKEGDGSYQAFLNNETRYSALTRKDPERAKVLFDRNEQAAKARFEHLQKLIELYK
ncbi:MAG: 2-oxoacid:acceptor oxidoreductase family protein, partial [Treponema sp.]|nr:2-oxoacid:acceptor oxidoreductase family protein [Candidatus Treponema equifaecale]